MPPFTYGTIRYHCHDFDPGLNINVNAETASIQTSGESYVWATAAREFRSLARDVADLHAKAVLKGIARDAGADPISIGQSPGGREVYTLVIGGTNPQPHKVLIFGCTHAREWISVEVPFHLARFLIDNYPAANSLPLTWTATQRRVKHLVDNREIWIIPMLNPDGHEYSRASNRMWRKNRHAVNVAGQYTYTEHWDDGGNLDVFKVTDPGGWTAVPIFGAHNNYRHNEPHPVLVPTCVSAACAHRLVVNTIPAATYTGVDINRNFPCASRGQLKGYERSMFDVDTSHDVMPAGDSWCGPAGVTEPETQLIVDLVAAQGFEAALSYHNYSELILIPDAANADAWLMELSAHMADLMVASRGTVYYPALGKSLYVTTGDFNEWSYENNPGWAALTIEVSPAESAHYTSGFSWVADAQIMNIFNDNRNAALAFINCAPHTSLSPPTLTQAIAPNDAVSNTVQAVRNCWRVFVGF